MSDWEVEVVERLDREQLIEIVHTIRHPKKAGLSSEEVNQKLLAFCVNCPDPGAAMDLIVECADPMTPQELVDRALAMGPRDVNELSASELPLNHPLRRAKLD